MEEKQKDSEGRYRRLFEESLVHNIMLATAYCIKDLLEDNPDLTDEDVYEFIEENYQSIIQDTLEEFQNQEQEISNASADEDINGPLSELDIDDENKENKENN